MADQALAARYHEVRARIEAACGQAGRSVDDITLVVVTKFHPPSLVRDLVELGVEHVGESRHQEAVAKHQELSDLPLTWHFVGQLQSNKARAVADYCQVIHSIDRASVVQKLGTIDHTVQGFIEVNLTGDPGRGGVEPEQLGQLVDTVLETPQIALRGLMAVAPQDQAPAAAFERVVALQDVVTSRAPLATDLSLGMTGDFEEAIQAGATHLRIGSAITGNRPPAP